VQGCSPAQAPGLQPHWQPLHRMCLPAAATAASMYTATASMHSVLTGMRAYYNPHQHSNPATYSLAGYHTSQQQQQQVAAPSAADLLAVVVGVSRLVQVAHGALHGNGECNLRNHVSRAEGPSRGCACMCWVCGLHCRTQIQSQETFNARKAVV
jgi:hypothetical protein